MVKQRMRVLLVLVILLLLPLSGTTYAQNDKSVQPSEEKKEPPAAPSVAEIVPMATQLAERSAALESDLIKVFNFAGAEEDLDKITKRTQQLSEELQKIKTAGNYGYDQLAELRGDINRQDDSLEKIIDSLTNALNRTDLWKEDWSKESQRWKELRSSVPKDVPLRAVTPTFAKADKTINKTLDSISKKLKSLLALQQKAGNIQSGLYSLRQEVDILLLAMRGQLWNKSADSMFSADYYAQFSAGLWGELRKGFDSLSWPGRKFLQGQGWLFILQILLSLGVTLNIRRNRSLFEQDERWRFIARRPMAAGIFFGFF
ncbi:MAG: hypothetical protein LJE88_02270, partial [Deltaproteobacteria bacterium]|nr:hypothetical protein [Deltaproteobacteria bacterium]